MGLWVSFISFQGVQLQSVLSKGEARWQGPTTVYFEYTVIPLLSIRTVCILGIERFERIANL